jgi:hypothetical protein
MAATKAWRVLCWSAEAAGAGSDAMRTLARDNNRTGINFKEGDIGAF